MANRGRLIIYVTSGRSFIAQLSAVVSQWSKEAAAAAAETAATLLGLACEMELPSRGKFPAAPLLLWPILKWVVCLPNGWAGMAAPSPITSSSSSNGGDEI